MGNFGMVEVLFGVAVMLLVLVLPVALFVWGVRKLAGSRSPESAIMKRLEALERSRPAE